MGKEPRPDDNRVGLGCGKRGGALKMLQMLSTKSLVLLAAMGLTTACAQNLTTPPVANPPVRPSRVQVLEPLLAQAGFKHVAIDTPAMQHAIAGLTPMRFNSLERKGVLTYYFPDSKFCNCVYIGDLAAYEKYKQLHQQASSSLTPNQTQTDQLLNSEVPVRGEWNPVGSMMFP
jgi:hypothetical protein